MTGSAHVLRRHRANDCDGAADNHREFERRGRKLEGRGKPLAEESENVAMQRDRGSEVAAQRIADPDGELGKQTAVEPVMRPERRDVRLACARRDHHRYGIAGHDPKENEHDDRDACERGERHQETPEDRQRDHRPVVTPNHLVLRRREAASKDAPWAPRTSRAGARFETPRFRAARQHEVCGRSRSEAPSSRLHPIAARRDRHPAAQVAGDTSVGCKAPDLFGMTLRSDL